MRKIIFTLFMLCMFISSIAHAYDFSAVNSDGVTIYYNIIDGGCEVRSGNSDYSGAVNIPSAVTYNSVTYSVTSIGKWAFEGCSGLTSITIPNSVTSIGDSAFDGCSGLTSIVVAQDNEEYDSRDKCNAIIEKRSNTLIAGCKNTVIPNSVTSIGDGAFANCSGLTSITIPNSVGSIGDYAFGDCSGLTSITIPNSVTSIGSSAFWDCSGLTSIVVEEGNNVYDSRENCNAIIEKNSNTLIAGCMNTVIPNSVTSIGYDAFAHCSGLTSITIPNSVTSIGTAAFAYCSSLTSITIPDSVTEIGYDAFYGCSGMTSIVVAQDNNVYDSRDNCNAIIEKSSNTLIAGCKNTLIPNSVASIGDWAFSYCSGLASIRIPNSVTSIGSDAFGGCSGLTSITIPNSVSSIGSYAFYNSNSLTDVYNCALTPQEINVYTFSKYNTLHVRKGCKEAYENANYWKNFTIVDDILHDEPTTDVSKYDNIIFINDTKQWPGKQTTMQLMLNNTDEITAMQFDLVLPDGVTIDKNARGNYDLTFNGEANRADVTTHTLQSSLQEDGSVRVLCYSNTSDLFLGNNGAVLDIPVTIAEDIVPGYYPIYINNVELTAKNEVQHKIAKVVCLLEVPDYEMGDVNKDTEVNVTDIVYTANHILGNEVPVFNAKAADMNGDNDISVTDIVCIANVILGNGNVSKSKGASRAAAGTASLSIAPITMESGASKTVTLDLTNPGREVTAFQYDLVLPEGISIDKNSRGKYNVAFDTTADRADYSSHTLSTEDQTDGSIRFLCYSAGMSTFLGDNGAVVDIPLSASSSMQGGTYDILLENVIITCTDNTEIKYDTLTATITIGDNTATAIDLPSADASATVYGINGQRRQAMSQGINIIRMGNGVVKKVAK